MELSLYVFQYCQVMFESVYGTFFISPNIIRSCLNLLSEPFLVFPSIVRSYLNLFVVFYSSIARSYLNLLWHFLSYSGLVSHMWTYYRNLLYSECCLSTFTLSTPQCVWLSSRIVIPSEFGFTQFVCLPVDHQHSPQIGLSSSISCQGSTISLADKSYKKENLASTHIISYHVIGIQDQNPGLLSI
jgi:hypothetical protein